jgi:hypothetical protein
MSSKRLLVASVVAMLGVTSVFGPVGPFGLNTLGITDAGGSSGIPIAVVLFGIMGALGVAASFIAVPLVHVWLVLALFLLPTVGDQRFRRAFRLMAWTALLSDVVLIPQIVALLAD